MTTGNFIRIRLINSLVTVRYMLLRNARFLKIFGPKTVQRLEILVTTRLCQKGRYGHDMSSHDRVFSRRK